jgi:TPR repeat protein
MRWLIIIGLVFTFAGASAHAASPTDVLCSPYDTAWAKVRGGTDVKAITAVVNSIPAGCPLKAKAKQRLAAVESHATSPTTRSVVQYQRPWAGASVDDNAYAAAKAADTNAAYNAYLSKYAGGRHVGEATAALSAMTASASGSTAASGALQAADKAYAANDYTEALHWNRIAAAQGNALAQANLGRMYQSGQGVPPDLAEALRWFRLSAAQGNAPAQAEIGLAYVQGDVVTQDYVMAMQWFRLAAAQGSPIAQFRIGLLYANGHGVDRDPAGAREWISKAAAQGWPPARRWLARRPD